MDELAPGHPAVIEIVEQRRKDVFHRFVLSLDAAES
jgi:hypothetical protein